MRRLMVAISIALTTASTPAAVFIANDVAPGDTAAVLTADKRAVKVSSATFAASDCGSGLVSAATRQMLTIGLSPVTTNIGTGIGGSFTLAFAPAVVVRKGETLTFSNGDSTCKTSVMVQVR